MLRAGVALAVLAAVLPGAFPGPTAPGAGAGAGAATIGHDVSFPQCGADLPASSAIAVVGVNDGLATGTNPCLAEQLAWARSATAADGSSADVVQLYVNTGNPGHAAAWWPTSGSTRDGTAVPAAYGTCTGGENPACAYVYGWSLARDDLARVPDSTAARWWLDVETINSWSADRFANLASVEGMAAAFAAAGVQVGLYSTARQWTAVVGGATVDGPLVGLPSWLAGAVTVAGARARCAAPGLVPGSRVLLAQVVAGGVDADVLCPVRPAAATPVAVPALPVAPAPSAAPAPFVVGPR